MGGSANRIRQWQGSFCRPEGAPSSLRNAPNRPNARRRLKMPLRVAHSLPNWNYVPSLIILAVEARAILTKTISDPVRTEDRRGRIEKTTCAGIAAARDTRASHVRRGFIRYRRKTLPGRSRRPGKSRNDARFSRFFLKSRLRSGAIPTAVNLQQGKTRTAVPLKPPQLQA